VPLRADPDTATICGRCTFSGGIGVAGGIGGIRVLPFPVDGAAVPDGQGDDVTEFLVTNVLFGDACRTRAGDGYVTTQGAVRGATR
jgi:hypothetical protein